MDENTRLIMEELQKMNERFDKIEERMTELEKTTAESMKTLGDKIEITNLKLDKLQDRYERMDADIRVLSGEIADGFYKTKHKIKRLEDQTKPLIKVLEFRKLLPLAGDQGAVAGRKRSGYGKITG